MQHPKYGKKLKFKVSLKKKKVEKLKIRLFLNGLSCWEIKCRKFKRGFLVFPCFELFTRSTGALKGATQKETPDLLYKRYFRTSAERHFEKNILFDKCSLWFLINTSVHKKMYQPQMYQQLALDCSHPNFQTSTCGRFS